MSAIIPAYLPPVLKQSQQDETKCHLAFVLKDALLMPEESENKELQTQEKYYKIFNKKMQNTKVMN